MNAETAGTVRHSPERLRSRYHSGQPVVELFSGVGQVSTESPRGWGWVLGPEVQEEFIMVSIVHPKRCSD